MLLRDQLYLHALDERAHQQTCGYWFTVTSRAMAHTAFRDLDHCLEWMRSLGLTIDGGVLPQRGVRGTYRITGAYRDQMHLNYDDFYALDGVQRRTLSNARYTLGIITQDADGLRTLHTLNPNCHDRPEYDYAESRAMVG